MAKVADVGAVPGDSSASMADNRKICEPCCRTRKRQFACCGLCCFPFCALVIAIVVCVVMLLPVKDTKFKMAGMRVWPGCTTDWPYEIAYTFDNPASSGVTIEACTIQLRRHSTGEAFATTELTDEGGIEISSGLTEHHRSGVFKVQHAEVMAQAIEAAVTGSSTDLLDVGAVVTFKASTGAVLGITLPYDSTVELTPEDWKNPSEVPEEDQCFTDPKVLAADITMERGSKTSIEAEIAAEARTGPCKPKWNFCEVHLPELDLLAVADGAGDTARFRMPAQSYNMQQPILKARGRLFLEESHISGASGLLQAVSDNGPDVTMRVRALDNDSCVLQKAMATVSYLAETDAIVSSSSTSTTDPKDALSLVSASGRLGGAAGNSAVLQVSVSLAALFPDVNLAISGTLPPISYVIDVEHKKVGCSPKQAATMLEIHTAPQPLAGSEPLLGFLEAAAADSFDDALVASISGATNRESSLTFNVRPSNDGSIASRMMSWWSYSWTAEIFPPSSPSTPAPSGVLSASLTSSAERLSGYWHLEDLIDSSSGWKDAQMSGSADLVAGDVVVGSASIDVAPLLAGLDASMEVGGSSTPRSRTEVLQAIHPMLQALLKGNRPSDTAATNANVNLKLPSESLDATLALTGSLWPPPSAGTTGGQSPTMAKLTMSGSAKVKELTVSPTASLLVDEAWGALAEGSMTAVGVLEGVAVDLILTLPALRLSSTDIGIDPCDEAGGEASPAWSLSDLQVAVLGGDAPGAPLEVPCFFKVACNIVGDRALPVTGGLAATIQGSLGFLRLGQVNIKLNTGAALQVTTSGTAAGVSERVVATVALSSGSCEMGSGIADCAVRGLVHEAGASDLLEGGSWRASVTAGATQDFLGAMFNNITIRESDSTSSSGSSVSAKSLMEAMQLISTSAQEMLFNLKYAVSNLLGVDVSILLGDVHLAGHYEGSEVLYVKCNVPEVQGLGSTTFDADMAMVAADSLAKIRLENLIEVLASDVERVTVPLAQVTGNLTSSRIPGGRLVLSMTLMIPNLYPDGSVGDTNWLLPQTGWSVFPLDFSPDLFGTGCPCINVEVRVHLTIYNPMWFGINVSDIQGTLHLKDPDGVSMLIFSYDPEPLHFIDNFSQPTSYSLPGRQNTSVTLPINLGAVSTALRIYDEYSQERMEFRLSDGQLLLYAKATGSAEGFQLKIKFHMASLTEDGLR